MLVELESRSIISWL